MEEDEIHGGGGNGGGVGSTTEADHDFMHGCT